MSETKGEHILNETEILPLVVRSGPSGISCNEIRTILSENYPGITARPVNQILYACCTSGQLERLDTKPPKFRSTKLERASLDFLSAIQQQKLIQSLEIVTSEMQLPSGVRFSAVAKATVVAVPPHQLTDVVVESDQPGRLRRSPDEAHVCAAHSLLQNIYRNNAIARSTRQLCQDEYKEALRRGRTYEFGSQWPYGEDLYTEFKGAEHDDERWSYNAFLATIKKNVCKTLCAFANSVSVYGEFIASSATIVFGVHDKTRIIHGIWRPVADDDPETQTRDLMVVEADLRERIGQQIKATIGPSGARALLESRIDFAVLPISFNVPPQGQYPFLVLIHIQLRPGPLCCMDNSWYPKRTQIHPATVSMTPEELDTFGIKLSKVVKFDEEKTSSVQSKFKVGDVVRAMWEDGNWYPCVIKAIQDDHFVIKYRDYADEVRVHMRAIKPPKSKAKR